MFVYKLLVGTILQAVIGNRAIPRGEACPCTAWASKKVNLDYTIMQFLRGT